MVGEYQLSAPNIYFANNPNKLFLNEYPAACCGWDGQETDLRNGAYSMLNN